VFLENLRTHLTRLGHCQFVLLVDTNHIDRGTPDIVTVGYLEESIHLGMNRTTVLVHLTSRIFSVLLRAPTMAVVTNPENLGTLSHNRTVTKPHIRVELVVAGKLPGHLQESLHEPVLP
jgi:hypothetical protein